MGTHVHTLEVIIAENLGPCQWDPIFKGCAKTQNERNEEPRVTLTEAGTAEAGDEPWLAKRQRWRRGLGTLSLDRRFLWCLISVMASVRRLGDEADTDAHVNPYPSHHGFLLGPASDLSLANTV